MEHNFNTIELEQKEGYAVITLNRSESLNAINAELLNDLSDCLVYLSKNEQLRCLIITGKGKAFAAGADIKSMSVMVSGEALDFSREANRVFSILERFRTPVIASINGYALGGGLELAMSCDLRISSVLAKMGMPETSLGLIPGFGGGQRLIRQVGYANALLLLTTAETVSAQEAMRIGLIQMVVAPDKLHETCVEIAEKIAAQGKNAVAKVKEILWKSIPENYDQNILEEASEFASLFGSDEANEGIAAFLEKRKPNWK